ncbi:MAG: SDR family NAD(P)-dependent oxidoreductase [Desulfobacterales bacterium]|nr:SDR family NAD(P)-dependent oxidoreductase [Desulfobacterales bacterium]
MAIVTGSGTGLGRAYALGLAQAGAKVVVNSRTAGNVAGVVEEIRKAGGTAQGCAVSVASMEGAREIIQAALVRNERPPTDADLGYFKPEEAAPLVVFLASDQAYWINGQFICIDGPRLAICEHTHHAKTAVMPGGWTVELLLEHFKATAGMPLQAYGFLTPEGRKIL